jgi:hypothetical protein
MEVSPVKVRPQVVGRVASMVKVPAVVSVVPKVKTVDWTTLFTLQVGLACHFSPAKSEVAEERDTLDKNRK